MKKVYSKPQIVFEDFTLNTNIAGDCETKTNTPSAGECAYVVDLGAYGTANVFLSDMVGICTTTEADGEYNSVCYHVPYGNNLFNS